MFNKLRNIGKGIKRFMNDSINAITEVEMAKINVCKELCKGVLKTCKSVLTSRKGRFTTGVAIIGVGIAIGGSLILSAYIPEFN